MFRWLVAATLLLSIGLCAAYEINGRRKIERIERLIAEHRADLQPLAAIAAEVESYKVQKSILYERIDRINPQKQNQQGAADGVAMLSAVEGDPSIVSVAVIDDSNVVINGHGESSAERVASKFPHAAKRVAPDHSFAVKATR